MVANDFNVKNAVSLLLQRVLHDPSRGIRVLSSETIGHFLKKNYIDPLFNHKFISSAMCLMLERSCVT